MPNESIVINTGPLILLQKIDEVEILGRLGIRFICPPAVRDELDAGAAAGLPAIKPSWLEVVPLSSRMSPVTEFSLDRGEAEVIQLAMERGIPEVCLDDLRGRRAANLLGLRVTGLLGLLALAKAKGVIPLLRPFSDKLISAGAWYSDELVRIVLAGVGEDFTD